MAQTPTDPMVIEFLDDRCYSDGQTTNYTSILNMMGAWLRSEFGVASLLDADKAQCAAWIAHRTASKSKTGAPISSSTLRKSWQAAHDFYLWAVEADEIDRSPMKLMKGPKVVENTAVRMGDRDDFDRFSTSIDRRRYEDRRALAVMACMAFAGLRVSEVLALNVGDVTFESNFAKLYIADPKNGKARTVTLVREGMVMLRRWMTERNGSMSEHAPVFTGSKATNDIDGRLTYSCISSWFDRYRDRTGHDLPPCHAWRRFAAHEMVQAGIDQVHIETMMGWKHDGKMIARYLGDKAEALAHDAVLAALDPEGGPADRARQRRADRNARHRGRNLRSA